MTEPDENETFNITLTGPQMAEISVCLAMGALSEVIPATHAGIIVEQFVNVVPGLHDKYAAFIMEMTDIAKQAPE